MDRKEILFQKQFPRFFIYIGAGGIIYSLVLGMWGFLSLKDDLVRSIWPMVILMMVVGCFILISLHRTPLKVYKNGVEIPNSIWKIWDKTWGIPSETFISFEDVFRFDAKTKLSKPYGVFVELNDGRRYLLTWGKKPALEDLSEKLNILLSDYKTRTKNV